MKKSLLILCMFFIIGAGLYSYSLNNSFKYDDQLYVGANMNIRSPGNIPYFFIRPRMISANPYEAGHYRPLVVMSYAINYAAGGLKPAGYHLVNLLFHVGSAFVLFMIVKTILNENPSLLHPPLQGGGKACPFDSAQDRPERSRRSGYGSFAALISGLIFLVHPFNSEAVNYATARSSVMSGFFLLLGFYFWMNFRVRSSADFDGRRPGHSFFYIASLFAFIASMLSKEVAVMLLALLWLYDLYFFSVPSDRKVKSSTISVLNWRTYLYYLPFVLIVLIPYLMLRLFSFGRLLPNFNRDIPTQIFTILPVLVKHWKMFIWPAGLSLVHYVNVYSEITWPVLLAGILLLLYAVTAVYMARVKGAAWRIISFFMFWFLIVLLPIIIFPLNAIFQENRGYIAIVSFAVITGVIAGEINRMMNPGGKLYKPLIAPVVILLVLYSGLTFSRNVLWTDDVRFWQDASEKSPQLGVVYAILADEYRVRGDIRSSLDTVRKGISVDPDSFHLRLTLAQNYVLIGKPEEAIREYEKALELDPRHATLWNDLGVLYAQTGNLERAESSLRKGLAMWGDLPKLSFNLGVILAGQGRLKEAVDAYRKAVNSSPGYIQARYELADTLEKLGRPGEAMEQYRTIVRFDQNGADAWSATLNRDRKMVGSIIQKARQKLAQQGE